MDYTEIHAGVAGTLNRLCAYAEKADATLTSYLQAAYAAQDWTAVETAADSHASSYGNSSDGIKRLRALLGKAIKDSAGETVAFTIKLAVVGETADGKPVKAFKVTGKDKPDQADPWELAVAAMLKVLKLVDENDAFTLEDVMEAAEQEHAAS